MEIRVKEMMIVDDMELDIRMILSYRWFVKMELRQEWKLASLMFMGIFLKAIWELA